MYHDYMTWFMRHFFLPHENNNFRAKALHVDSLFVYLLLFTVFHLSLSAGHRLFPNVLGYATDIHVEQLLNATNDKRQQQGLSLLSLNEKLSAAAAQKAVDMFSKNYWAHNSPEGKTPWEFIIATGYQYAVAGENLAKNFDTSGNVVEAWMDSPTHRDNILKSSYKDVGFAVVNGVLNGEETTLVVQMFGTSVQQPVSQTSQKPVEVPTTPVAHVSVAPTPAVHTVASAFESVSKKPLLSIPVVSRDITFIFLGIIMTILLFDAWLVSRKKIVRIAGHNIAHFVFFATIATLMSFFQRGSLL